MSLTHFTISHTRGVEAPVGKPQSVTLQDLADLAKRTKADHKENLPMWIGGTFDETRRRANDNMLSVTCILGDYDNGEMRPAEAAAKLKAANIQGAIITSPRHQMQGMKGNAQRWRVVCPLSKPVTLLEHAALARRLNGVFGPDVLGTEGKSASRPYYYGYLEGRAPCETYVIEGDCLDTRDDIAEVRFPRSVHEQMSFPVLSGDADAQEIGRVVLTAAAKFTGGHEGLRPACMMIAPFVRLGAIDPEEVGAALQEQLLATSSRRPEDLPDNEALRTLRWAMYSDNISEAVEHLETAIQLEEMDVTTAVRKLAVRYTDATDDFDYADPLPDDPAEDAVVERSRKRGAFTFLSPVELRSLPKPEWLIEGVLPAEALVYLWGPPKSGKSFVALSMALAMANGSPWFERAVNRPGRVYYIMGEGAGGACQRVDAALDAYGIPDSVPFFVLPRAARFTDDDEVEKLEAAIRAHAEGQPVAAVFIDTLSRSIPGVDENAAVDMSAVVKRCDTLKENLRCTIIPVHHSSKDLSRGMRGSNVLSGSADCSFKVTRDRGVCKDVMHVENEFQKDAAEFEPLAFRMTPHRESVILAPCPVEKETPETGKSLHPRVVTVLNALIGMRDAIPNSPVTMDDLATELQDNTDLSTCARRVDRKRAAITWIGNSIKAGVLALDGDNLVVTLDGQMPPVADDDPLPV